MRILSLIKVLGAFVAVSAQTMPSAAQVKPVGESSICKWQDGKDAAVSLTYDDGNVNQFRVALPIMNRLHLPATFFIMTGQYPGSKYQGKFIGRPVEEIIKETATVPSSEDNFLERASALPYLGYIGPLEYHVKAGSLHEAGKTEEAFKLLDEVYKKVRNGEFKKGLEPGLEVEQAKGITWDDIRSYAKQGHEFGSHTITHHMTPVLDEPNLLYELEKSKEDILNQLGPEHTFSAECSYGVENPRVMQYALKIYPALRNRMPAPYLAELNRGSKKLPGNSDKEYVQWQRGATTKTSMPLMKSWVDTVLTHDNNWLVLVIHGVDSVGWEPMTHQQLEEYFQYIKDRENKLWVATFGEVTKYIRERKNAKIRSSVKGDQITVNVTHSLNKTMYHIPLTLKTYVPASWKNVQVKQGNKTQKLKPMADADGSYLLYRANPNSSPVELSKL
ncbi:polysaccharide deacetylase family protein [Rubrolithibacter danxiaensis]|uniref:polysaccharide deacetylase family protein n=1 Tax=Rubrolithibacter danxiaensis TaxID=3390805 RepID=UPI003BF814F9